MKSFPYLFICSFIHLYQYELIDSYFIHKVLGKMLLVLTSSEVFEQMSHCERNQ